MLVNQLSMMMAAEGTEPSSGGTAAPAATEAPAGDAKAPVEGQADPGATDADKAAPPKPAEAKAEPEKVDRDVQARVELKRRQAELVEREGKVKLAEADHAELAEWRSLRDLAKEDSGTVLERLGLTVETVFRHAKEGMRGDPLARKALQESTSLRKQLEQRDAAEKKAKEDAAAAETSTKVKTQLGGLLKSDADRFELTLARGERGVERFREGCIAYYNKFGRGPDQATALKIADNIEKYYRTQADAVVGTKYVKGKLAPKPPKPATAAEPATGLDNDADASAIPKPKPARVTAERTATSVAADIQSDWEAVKKERAAREAAANAQ